jgi:hypothetical protein
MQTALTQQKLGTFDEEGKLRQVLIGFVELSLLD